MISVNIFLCALVIISSTVNGAMNNTTDRRDHQLGHSQTKHSDPLRNHTEIARNLTVDDAARDMEFLTELENAILKEMIDFENVTGYYYNQTTIIFNDLVNDPCVRNGNSTLPAVFAFFIGLISFPILKCSCTALCRRGNNVRQQRRYLRGQSKSDQADLNKLIEEATANDSDIDI